MRARTLLLLVLAVVIAGGTAMLARSWLAAQRARELAQVKPAAAPKPTKSVLVARADIKRGQILRAEDLVWQVWPDGSLDKNYILSSGPKKPETFAGWVAKEPIGGGEPVTDAKIIAPGDRGFLAAVLHPGMRAISVPVTVTSGISGFIFPGDSVDLLLSYPVPRGVSGSDYEHKAVETVLRNVRVIAIDQRLQSKEGEAVVAHTATFEVSPKESEIITLANEIGKLSLSLRSLVPGVDGTPGQESATEEPAQVQLANAVSPLDPKEVVPTAVKVAASEPPAAASVTVEKGTSKTESAGNRKPDSANGRVAGGQSHLITPPTIGGDSKVANSATYTTDNEISALLPAYRSKDNSDGPKLEQYWIAKGPALSRWQHPEVYKAPTAVAAPATGGAPNER